MLNCKIFFYRISFVCNILAWEYGFTWSAICNWLCKLCNTWSSFTSIGVVIPLSILSNCDSTDNFNSRVSLKWEDKFLLPVWDGESFTRWLVRTPSHSLTPLSTFAPLHTLCQTLHPSDPLLQPLHPSHPFEPLYQPSTPFAPAFTPFTHICPIAPPFTPLHTFASAFAPFSPFTSLCTFALFTPLCTMSHQPLHPFLRLRCSHHLQIVTPPHVHSYKMKWHLEVPTIFRMWRLVQRDEKGAKWCEEVRVVQK